MVHLVDILFIKHFRPNLCTQKETFFRLLKMTIIKQLKLLYWVYSVYNGDSWEGTPTITSHLLAETFFNQTYITQKNYSLVCILFSILKLYVKSLGYMLRTWNVSKRLNLKKCYWQAYINCCTNLTQLMISKSKLIRSNRP